MTLATAILYSTPENIRQEIYRVEHLNFIDEYGFTPLIEAAIVNDIAKVRLLLEHGADVNFPDLTGTTALHWAVENSNLELCQLLLEHKANPNSYTLASQPVLVKALLRKDKNLKDLLCEAGASLTFAQDFINTKLLGHMYELISSVDIVDNEGRFTEIDFEGFFLESSLDLIRRSIADFRNNYSARKWRPIFTKLREIIKAMARSAELIQYQQYLTDIRQYKNRIYHLLSVEPLIIPISQEGHAITLIKHGSLFSICDRAKYENKPGEIIIYYANRPSKLTKELICELIYKKQPLGIFHKALPKELGLQPVVQLPIHPQLSGNCSWANVEACMPILFLMFSMNDPQHIENNVDSQALAMEIFTVWREWEKDRSLSFCIKDFHRASPARKASKISILSAILFQGCSADDEKSVERAMQIIPLLKTKEYEYVLKNYIEIYCHRKATKSGENLKKLLDIYERFY